MATAVAARFMTRQYVVGAKWATVRVETEGTVYVGKVFVPESKRRLSDVLCDDRPFVNITEVTVNGAKSGLPFIAINKRFIKTVQVLQDGEIESTPLELE
jgi:hypothetical protein